MSEELRALLSLAARELRHLLDPLAQALDDPRRLYALFAELGWDLDGLLGDAVDLEPLAAAVAEARAELDALEAATTGAPDAAAAVDAVFAAVHEALALVDAARDAVVAGTVPALDDAAAAALAADLAQHLWLWYLQRRAPLLLRIAYLVGLVVDERPAPIVAGARTLRHSRARPAFALAAAAALGENAAGALLAGVRGGGGSPADLVAALERELDLRLALLEAELGSAARAPLELTLDIDGLRLSGFALPLLVAGAAPVSIPLPVDGAFAPALEIAAGGIGVTWAPPGGADGRVPLVAVDGFELAALPPADGAPRGLTVRIADGAVSLTAAGGLGVRLPLDVLQVEGEAELSALVELTAAPGVTPTLTLDRATAGPVDVRLGGAAGPRVRNARLELTGLTLPPAADPLAGLGLTVEGELELAPDVTCSARAELDADGFHVASTAAVALPGGVRLGPVGDRPVLEARVDFGSAPSAAFTLAAGVSIPHADGTREVELGGTLVVGDENGLPAIREVSAQSVAVGAWELADGLVVTGAQASLELADGTVRVGLGGGLELGDGADARAGGTLAATLVLNGDDPEDVRIDAALAGVEVALLGQLRVLGGEVRLVAASKPPAAALTLRDGTAGLFLREGVDAAAAGADDFLLLAEDVDGELAATAAGLRLRLTSGTLHLPDVFDAAGERPSASLADGPGLTAELVDGRLTFAAAVTVGGFRAKLPVEDGPEASLDSATLVLADDAVPELRDAVGTVTLPLPNDEVLAIRFSGVRWLLDGLPAGGRIALAQDVTLPLGGDFAVVFLGDATGAETGLSFTRDGGVVDLDLTAAGRVVVPADLLTEVDGDEAAIGATVGLRVRTDALDRPDLSIDELVFESSELHLGGEDGLRISGAALTAEHLDALFDDAAAEPFALTLTGRVHCPVGEDGSRIVLDLTDARFTLAGDRPDFDFREVGVSTEGPLFEALPLAIDAVSVGFSDELPPDTPLAQKLRPEYLQIGFDAHLSVPLGSSGEGALGAVTGVEVELRDGVPHVTIDGFAVGIERLEVPAVGAMSGVARVQGLTDLANLVFAGKLEGYSSGMGVGALFAARLKRDAPSLPPVFVPLGLCLDVSGGSAGIPLGQTGFLFTGASGGVSFANSNRSPCDIRAYFPEEPQNGSGSRGDGERLATGRPQRSSTGCPDDCPPLAMNILCQPHPTEDRAILKFSAIDEATLNEAGITHDLVAGLVGDGAGSLADAVVGRLAAPLQRLLPPPPPVQLYPAPRPAELEQILRDPAGFAVAGLREALVGGLDGITSADAVYAAIREIAWAGLPCPDMTLQVTATFSYSGVSAFLSVTGGGSVSTAGSVGVLGTLNVLGIPMGKARVFLTLTGPTGDPDPSLCGDVRFAVGPLELGLVGIRFAVPGFIGGVIDALVAAGESVGGLAPGVVDRTLAAIAAEVREHPDYDPDAPQDSLARLSQEQAIAFVAYLDSFRASGDVEQVEALFRALLVEVLDRCEPEAVLCGRVAPRLFGVPIGGEGLVDFYGEVRRDGLEASLSFSVIGLMNYITIAAYLLAGGDTMTLGIAVPFPDPADLAASMLRGQVTTAEELAEAMEAGLERLLRDGVLTIQWDLTVLGLELGDLAGRVVLPYLTPHPEHPASAWEPPPLVANGGGPPSRVDVLVNAVEGEELGKVQWKGGLDAAGRPVRAGAVYELQRDYFPHGGLAAAGAIRLPRALLEAPPDCLSTLLDTDAEPLDRILAALEYVTDYLLAVETYGSLAFYLPAPAPPFLTRPDGSEPGVAELLDQFRRYTLTPEQLRASSLLRTELAFMRGYVECSLLGLPLGRADVAASGPTFDAPSGYVGVTATAGAGTWLARFFTATFELRLQQRPPRPVQERFTELKALLEAAEADARADRGSHAAADLLVAALADDLPKASLEASLTVGPGTVSVPAELGRWLGFEQGSSLTVAAYSPRYAPDAPGTGPLAEAKRRGGIVFAGRLAITFPGLASVGADAELSVIPDSPAALPRLAGSFRASGNLAPGGLTLRNLTVSVDTAPEHATDAFLSAAGELDPIRLGWFELTGAEGGRLAARLDVLGQATDAALRSALVIQPARLRAPFLAGQLALVADGGEDGQPFRLETGLGWSVRLRTDGWLAVQSPVDPTDPPVLQGTLAAGATLAVTRTGRATLDLELDAPTVFPGVELVPGVVGFQQPVERVAVHATDRRSLTVTVRMRPVQLGIFVLHDAESSDGGFDVKASARGLRFPRGLKVSLDGLATQELRLRGFVANGRGDLRVTATGRTLHLGPWLRATGGSLRFRREGGAARVSLTSPRVTLFPGSPFETAFPLRSSLVVESDGSFAATYDAADLALGPFRFTGALRIAATPVAGAAPALSVTAAGALSLPLLPEPISGTFELTPTGFTVSLREFGVPGLFECGASSWTVEVADGAVTLRAQSPRISALGVSVPAAEATATFGDGTASVAVSATQPITLVPDLLELGGGSAFTFVQGDGGPALTAAGTVRVLKKSSGTDEWLLTSGFDVQLSATAFSMPLSTTTAVTLVALPGILSVTVPPGGVTLARAADGSFAVSLRLAVRVLDRPAATLTAAVDTTGSASATWSGGSIQLGAFTLTLDGVSGVTLSGLRGAPAAAVDLSAGRLSFPSSWGVSDIEVGALRFDAASAAELSVGGSEHWIDVPGFDGWEVGVTSPRVAVSASGSAKLHGGGAVVRSKDTIDGKRWAEGRIDLPEAGLAVSSSGKVTLELTSPSVVDHNAHHRENCVNELVDAGAPGWSAEATCLVKWPKPPDLPTITITSLRVDLAELLG